MECKHYGYEFSDKNNFHFHREFNKNDTINLVFRSIDPSDRYWNERTCQVELEFSCEQLMEIRKLLTQDKVVDFPEVDIMV